jgi:exopolysaccharide biosynthesis polyprenyl glycosylphosphotransferase
MNMSAPDFVASNLFTEKVAHLRKERSLVSRKLFQNAMILAEASADCLACMAGMIAASALCGSVSFAGFLQHPSQKAIAFGAAAGVIVVFLLRRDGIYKKDSGLLQIRDTERTLLIAFQALFLLLSVSWILGLGISWPEIPVAIVLVPILLVVEKQILFSLAAKLQRTARMERVIVYGAGETARRVLSTLLQSPRLGLLPVAIIDAGPEQTADSMLEMGYRGRGSFPVQLGPVTAAKLQSFRGNLLVLASSDLSPQQIAQTTEAAEQSGMSVATLRGPAVQEHRAADFIDAQLIEIDGLSFTTSKIPAGSRLYELVKRAVDVAASALLLVLLAPVFILIAIIIRLDSPGPALFIQQRVGRNGALFNIFKFRSMFTTAPKYAASPTSSHDPRITRVGRLLRRTSLDELPQLINVLLGAMSLVGPRPEMPFIVETYDARQRRRLQIVPGITCLWQLSADRSFPIHHNIQYDLYYIRNRGFFVDVAILIHTLFFAMRAGV